MQSFEEAGQALGALVERKNKAYGNSFGLIGDFLRLLYPNGATPEQFPDVLLLVRIFDKMVRIATGAPDEECPYQDIAGYGLLGMRLHEPTDGDVTVTTTEPFSAGEECPSCHPGKLYESILNQQIVVCSNCNFAAPKKETAEACANVAASEEIVRDAGLVSVKPGNKCPWCMDGRMMSTDSKSVVSCDRCGRLVSNKEANGV